MKKILYDISFNYRGKQESYITPYVLFRDAEFTFCDINDSNFIYSLPIEHMKRIQIEEISIDLDEVDDFISSIIKFQKINKESE